MRHSLSNLSFKREKKHKLKKVGIQISFKLHYLLPGKKNCTKGRKRFGRAVCWQSPKSCPKVRVGRIREARQCWIPTIMTIEQPYKAAAVVEARPMVLSRKCAVFSPHFRASWMTWIICEMADSWSSFSRLNSSKQPQAGQGGAHLDAQMQPLTSHSASSSTVTKLRNTLILSLWVLLSIKKFFHVPRYLPQFKKTICSGRLF